MQYGPGNPLPPPGLGAPPYGGPPPAMGSAAVKPADPVRLLVGAGGFGLLALHAVASLAVDRASSTPVLLLTLMHVAATGAIAVGLTGVRATTGILAAVANGFVALLLLMLEGMRQVGIESAFIYRTFFVVLDGWMFAAAAMNAVALLTNAKKLGPAAFGGGGLFGVSALIGGYWLSLSVLAFLKQPIDYSRGLFAVTQVVVLLAALASAAALVLGKLKTDQAARV